MRKNLKIDELSIVIPIYNEEKNITKLSNLIKKNLKIKKFEIIFVDDDSTDNSKRILEDINKKDRRIKSIIRKNKKKDLSKSCILGFRKSKYKIILVMDGDLQHNPIFIPKLINSYNSSYCDLVVGCRGQFTCSSNTWGIAAGGEDGTGSPYVRNHIDYVTIASAGNATDFGDIVTSAQGWGAGCSDVNGGLG